jgi:hypothetical protein
MSSTRVGQLVAVAAYVVPAIGFGIAHAMAGPAMGGPTPPDASDIIAFSGLIVGVVCGFVAFMMGRQEQSTGIKVAGGLAVVLGGLALLLSATGPTFA